METDLILAILVAFVVWFSMAMSKSWNNHKQVMAQYRENMRRQNHVLEIAEENHKHCVKQTACQERMVTLLEEIRNEVKRS